MGQRNKMSDVSSSLAILIVNSAFYLVALSACVVNIYHSDAVPAITWLVIFSILTMTTLRSLKRFLRRKRMAEIAGMNDVNTEK